VRQQLLRIAMCVLYPPPASPLSAHLAAYPDDVIPGVMSIFCHAHHHQYN